MTNPHKRLDKLEQRTGASVRIPYVTLTESEFERWVAGDLQLGGQVGKIYIGDGFSPDMWDNGGTSENDD